MAQLNNKMPARPLSNKEKKWFIAQNEKYSVLNKGEYFFFRDDEEGNIAFNVQDLRTAVADKLIPSAVVDLPVTEELFRAVWGAGLPDLDYARTISDARLKVPILAVVFERGEFLLIDGNNRVTAAYLRGWPSLRLIIVGWPWWKPYSLWAKDAPLPAEFSAKFVDLARRDAGLS